ncbi:MAG: hypothetical protein J5526_01525 [Bacteroidales bacterium]|nr:hypothetical protein [Bacteroidales bacterium]
MIAIKYFIGIALGIVLSTVVFERLLTKLRGKRYGKWKFLLAAWAIWFVSLAVGDFVRQLFGYNESSLWIGVAISALMAVPGAAWSYHIYKKRLSGDGNGQQSV